MEPESLLPCLQQPTTGPYPDTDESSPHPYTLFKVHFNIILPSMPWFLPFSFFD